MIRRNDVCSSRRVPFGVGDPRPSTAEMGEVLLEASAAEVAADVVAIRALKPFER